MVAGNARLTVFTSCSSYSNANGFALLSAPQDNNILINCRSIANTDAAFYVNRATARLIGCVANNAHNGVAVDGGQAYISDCVFQEIANAHMIAYNSGLIVEQNNKFENHAQVGGWIIPQILSSDPIAIPQTGDFFVITGTTDFGKIFGGWPGRRVVLKFDDTLTVFDGAVANIAGNFTTSKDAVLELIHDGTQWLELGRSRN
jgi:hypothetical protein